MIKWTDARRAINFGKDSCSIELTLYQSHWPSAIVQETEEARVK
jgi:hypothetical protein